MEPTNLGRLESVVEYYSKTTTYDVSYIRLYATCRFMSWHYGRVAGLYKFVNCFPYQGFLKHCKTRALPYDTKVLYYNPPACFMKLTEKFLEKEELVDVYLSSC